MREDEAIGNFWHWFMDHRADFDVLVDPAAPFWDVAVKRLKELDDRLWFELSRPDGDDRELILTAEGHVDLFPLVEAIIAQAPPVAGWRFVALKPARGFAFVTTYEGIRFEPRAMWFLPLESLSEPRSLILRIGVPNWTSDIERQANSAVLVILETGLGERFVATEIERLEVGELPASPDAHGYRPFLELPVYLASQKPK